MHQTYYLQTGSTDPAYNLAFEETVLRSRTNGDYLILWQNENAVIIGRNQNALEEINREFIQEHGIAVVRRNTGGGAVYHDLGNLNYSFITDYTDGDTAPGNRFARRVTQALCELGLDAVCSGRNDILVNGQKVSGTAQHRCGNRILHHGTLLFDSDPEMIAGSLNPDPEKFRSKSIKSVRSRVGNIRAALQNSMTMHEFWDYLRRNLSDDGAICVSLRADELQQVQTLVKEKYSSWKWNFGSSPKFDTAIRRRFPGGLLQIGLSVQHGNIAAIQIQGDFLALEPVQPLENVLLGLPYRRDALWARLMHFPMHGCLGTITAEELIQAILNE